ncbi:dynamin-like GTPase mgm1 [Actinomortierella wolfii]|nr:dynamin-like GTPase mgm1 [Actinomortierella wolfii]
MLSRLLAEAPAVARVQLVRARQSARRLPTSHLLSSTSPSTVIPRGPFPAAVARTRQPSSRCVSSIASSTSRNPTSNVSNFRRSLANATGVQFVSRAMTQQARFNRARLLNPAFQQQSAGFHSYAATGAASNSAGPFLFSRRYPSTLQYRVRKGINVVVPRRGLAASAAPRFIMHALRLPIGALTAGMASLSYAQYKVTELSNRGTDWAMSLAEDVREFAGLFKSAVDDIHLPEAPEFLSNLFKAKEASEAEAGATDPTASSTSYHNTKSRDEEPDNGGNNNKHNNNRDSDAAAAAAAAAAALAKSKSEEDKENNKRSGIPPHDGDFMLLTKKLIEVRNVLKSIDHNDTLKLPSIVVIGSQSSGKSSVLEAIVGHEFLPKGHNMVTRRPIELTLIHTPQSKDEYGEFPSLGLGKVTDFKKIQQTLMDLNMAVPESECVSSKPIELRIYSPNVPDLTMIDLPGYIQITSKNQPVTLKEKISELCEKYIQEPNIILAVCAADVDLANSEALRSSRKVDPLGLRTIGVITKMDLVEPERGVALLKNTDYPLHLGYIGVVCKAPSGNSKDNITQAVIRSEDAFFRSSYQYSQRGVQVGTGTLRRKLMDVLEENMGSNLGSIIKAVQRELDETRYQFKVEYNDQRISAESYVADAVDKLKHQFKDFTKAFGRPQVKNEIRHMLEQRMLDICAQRYWSDPRIRELSQLDNSPTGDEDRLYWDLQLELSSSALTKSGVGRQTTQRVVDILTRTMEMLAQSEPFNNHPEAQEKIKAMTHEILSSRSQATADQVENTIKPFKYEVECTDGEWTEGVKRAISLLQTELHMCEEALSKIKTTVGQKKLRKAINYVIEMDREEARRAERKEATMKLRAAHQQEQRRYLESKSSASTLPMSSDEREGTSTNDNNDESASSVGDEEVETEDELEAAMRPHYNPKLLNKAREALALRDRALILKYRLSALKSKTCKSSKNKTQCPEAFLAVVAEKLAYTSVMFIQVELMNEFVFQLPRLMDARLGVKMGQEAMEQFARENPVVGRHLALMDKRMKLEEVWEKLNYLVRRQEEARSRRW